MTISEKIRKLRASKNWSQKQLAESIGLQRTTIAQYETGRITPSGEALKRLARLFSVSLDVLADDRLPLAVEGFQLARNAHVDGSYIDTMVRLSAKSVSDELVSRASLIFSIEPDATYQLVEAILRINCLAGKEKRAGIRIACDEGAEEMDQFNEHIRTLCEQILDMEKTYDMFRAHNPAKI